MKNFVCVLCILFIGISNNVFAEKLEVIDTKNEFGGITAVVTYSSGDQFYKTGIEKLIGYLDGNKKMVKLENIFTDRFASQHLKAKTIEHYDHSENNIVKFEEFYTHQYSKLFGVAKQITYHDSNEKTVKIEKFYTAAWTKKKGITKNVIYNDSKGRMVKKEEFKTDEGAGKNGIVKKIEFYDGKGKPVRSENYDQNGKLVKILP